VAGFFIALTPYKAYNVVADIQVSSFNASLLQAGSNAVGYIC
jgi:hypothetical protein